MKVSHAVSTCDVEDHVLVSGGGAAEVAAVDAGVVSPRAADDEHRQRAVVRSVDAVAPVVDRHVLAERYAHRRARLRPARRLLLHPVNLPTTHATSVQSNPHRRRTPTFP